MVMECVNEPSNMKGDKDVFYYTCAGVCAVGSRRRKVFFQLLSSENYNTYLMSMVRGEARSHDQVT